MTKSKVVEQELILKDEVSKALTVTGLDTATEVLAVFTSENGLNDQVNQVRELVKSFDHNMKNLKGRGETKTLSANIGKFKAKLEKAGKALTDAEKAKIEDVQALIKVINNNVKEMGAELAKLKTEARKPLTEWENEQKAKKEKKAEQEKQKMLDLQHENALLLNEKFDAEKAEEEKAEIERLRLEQIAHDEEVAQKAIEDAQIEKDRLRIENEQNEARLIQEKVNAEANTIHYWVHRESDDFGFVVGNNERDLIITNGYAEITSQAVYEECVRKKQAYEQKLIDDANTEKMRVQQENLASQKLIEEQANEARLIKEEAERVETARIAEENRVEQLRVNNQYVAQVCGGLKVALMDVGGISEPSAKAIVLALRDGTLDTRALYKLYPQQG